MSDQRVSEQRMNDQQMNDQRMNDQWQSAEQRERAALDLCYPGLYQRSAPDRLVGRGR